MPRLGVVLCIEPAHGKLRVFIKVPQGMVEVKKDVFVFLFHHCAKLGELGVVRQSSP